MSKNTISAGHIIREELKFFEDMIENLEAQVYDLENAISNRDVQIYDLQEKIQELQSKLDEQD